MRKNILLCTLCSIAFLFIFGACNMTSESNTTPDIRYASPITRHAADTLMIDTLLVTVGENGYVLDTIEVGDTVCFDLLFNTGLNNMQRIHIKHDTTCSQLYYFFRDQLETLVLPSSNFETGEFLFETGVMAIRMQVGYIATAPDNNPQLQFNLESDSKYSPGRRTITTPIVPKKD